MKAYRSYLVVCIFLLTSLISGCCLRPPLAETAATGGTTEALRYPTEPSETSLPTEESSEMWPEKLTRPESIPQSGVPITPQPGDTSATRDRSKAEQFPSDDDCTDMELLEKWTAVEGVTYADLDERGCTQLLLVCACEPDGVEAYAVCYEEQDGTWKLVEGFGRMHAGLPIRAFSMTVVAVLTVLRQDCGGWPLETRQNRTDLKCRGAM